LILSSIKKIFWRELVSQNTDITIPERLIEDLEDIIGYINIHFTTEDVLDNFSLPENFIEDLLEQLENARKQLEKAML